ncbi:MAG TPA: (4Fe-4S)-binding protein, partial [Thermoplasmatales archaeon]|nr:(4Fe-4S)-binding protein [Thermoplasmatales archaeon]
IELKDRESGFLYISETRFGPMSHAILKTAEEASGKLVTMVRENAKKLALEEKKDLIIIDGPPGIGCPVISAITGVDLVLIVTEPTLSAIHDLKRVFDVAKHFDIPSTVLINKYDINIDNTNDIIDFCSENDIPIVGRLPYDEIVTKAMVDGKTIIEYSNGEFPNRIKEIWMKAHSFLNRGV